MFLFLTADEVGKQSGGGAVTAQEFQALQELGQELGQEVKCVGRSELEDFHRSGRIHVPSDPWCWDWLAYHQFGSNVKLLHVYAGTFSSCVEKVVNNNTVVTYTCAAHDRKLSKQEHDFLGVPYDYPHMVDDKVFQQYANGYALATKLIVPSTYSRDVVIREGIKTEQDVAIIPHGCHLPKEEDLKPLPLTFRVGYLGAVGPDKGLIYLLQAWKNLNYKDAVLELAGKYSDSEFVTACIKHFGGGQIYQRGWVDKIEDFYNGISLYVQPSVSEGFGCEVLEAMAFARPVVCSDGVGAADLLRWDSDPDVFSAKNVDELADFINTYKYTPQDVVDTLRKHNRIEASNYSWDKIRERYKQLWRELLKEQTE